MATALARAASCAGCGGSALRQAAEQRGCPSSARESPRTCAKTWIVRAAWAGRGAGLLGLFLCVSRGPSFTNAGPRRRCLARPSGKAPRSRAGHQRGLAVCGCAYAPGVVPRINPQGRSRAQPHARSWAQTDPAAVPDPVCAPCAPAADALGL